MIKNVVFYCLLLLQIILGFLTVNAVIHWDEAKLVDTVIHQYNKGSFLAEWYNYPSLIFDLTYINYFFWDHFLKTVVSNFNVFNRLVFFILSQAPAVIAFHIFKKRDHGFLGLFIALVFWASWEYHYHSRWVAPDTMAASLGFASLVTAYRKKIIVSSILAGLAFGTKYTAGIFILPVLVFSFHQPIKGVIKNWIIIVLLFISTFLLTSPGIFINYSKAIADIRWEQHHYATGHNNYTVPDFFTHLRKNVYYLVFEIGSRSKIIAALIFISCMYTFVSVAGKKKYPVLIAGFVFVAYVIYISTQKVMFVRNLMLLWPIISMMAAWPLVRIIKDTSKITQWLSLCLVFILAFGWIIKQDLTIIQRGSTDQAFELQKYIQANPGTYNISGYIRKNNLQGASPLEVDKDHEYYVFYLSEAIPWKLPANSPGWFTKDFGIQESNLNYYSTTQNNDRIIIVKDSAILTNAGVSFE